MPEGTDINNIRLVNNQSADRKRRETNENLSILVDLLTPIEIPAANDGPTIEVDISGGAVADAIAESGGTVIDTTVEDTANETNDDTAQGGEDTTEDTTGDTSNGSNNNDASADQTSEDTSQGRVLAI